MKLNGKGLNGASLKFDLGLFERGTKSAQNQVLQTLAELTGVENEENDEPVENKHPATIRVREIQAKCPKLEIDDSFRVKCNQKRLAVSMKIATQEGIYCVSRFY